MKSSLYEVVQVVTDESTGDKIVWIIDLCDCPGYESRSVTNDAEAVCSALNERYPHHRIIYCDTMGKWGELKHEGGKFAGFLPGRHMEPAHYWEGKRKEWKGGSGNANS